MHLAGAPKGTQLSFSTGGGSLDVAVNGKKVGAIRSKVLASAFANIYSDKNAVCAMNAVGADGAVSSGGGGMFCPTPKALAGAVMGYGIGKLLS